MAYLKKTVGLQYDSQTLATNKTKPVQSNFVVSFKAFEKFLFNFKSLTFVDNNPVSEIKKTYAKLKGVSHDENDGDIDGFLPKDQLQAFFTNRKNMYTCFFLSN